MARTSRKDINEALVSAVTVKIFEVGAYVRLSAVDRKQKGDSVETQQAIIKSYISERSDLTIRDIYIDNGFSGQTFHRPEFERMLEDMKRGKINCCITKDLSRLGRNPIEAGYYIEKHFPLNNIRYIAINDAYDSYHEKSGGITISLKNMINEMYVLEVGRKVRATKQMNIRNGCFVGRIPPYGYQKSSENKYKLVPDSYAAPIVRRMFEMAADGKGVSAISQWLNNTEILPPKRYFNSIGLVTPKEANGHIHWNKGILYGILHNRVYCGDMVQGKYTTYSYVQKRLPADNWVITENTHEGVVSHELFAKVQALWADQVENTSALPAKASRSKSGAPSVNRYKRPSSENIFKRKVFCGHCGYTMRRKRTSEKIYWLKCETRHYYDTNDCVFLSISERELKAGLVEAICKQALVFKDSIKNTVLLAEIDKRDKIELHKVQADLKEKSKHFASLYQKFAFNLLHEDEYRDLKQSYSKQIQEAEVYEENLKKAIMERHLLNTAHTEVLEYFQSVRRISDLNAEIIDMLVEKILVYEDKRIDIVFNFTEQAK